MTKSEYAKNAKKITKRLNQLAFDYCEELDQMFDAAEETASGNLDQFYQVDYMECK